MFFCFFLLFDYSLDSKSKSHRLQLTWRYNCWQRDNKLLGQVTLTHMQLSAHVHTHLPACTHKQGKQALTHGDTDPIGSCHLHNDLSSRSIEEASVSPHHHGWTLAIAQVNGREDTLDEVVKVVPSGLEHIDLFPQAVGAGSLVWVGGCRDSQDLQRAVVHCFKIKV